MASCSNFTTSSLTTPEQLKPLVHAVNRAEARPSCLQGNENVKPRQRKKAISYVCLSFVDIPNG